MDIKKDMIVLVGIVFLLMGALFGVNIMSFIFGNLGSQNEVIFDDIVINNSNVSFLAINSSANLGTLPQSAFNNFSGSFSITSLLDVTNASNVSEIPTSQYTVTSGGIITNATATAYNQTNATYTYGLKSENRLTSEDVTNQSLQSGLTYAQNASNQMNIVNVTIILALLIFLFFLFWTVIQRVTGTKTGSSGSSKGKGDSQKSTFS